MTIFGVEVTATITDNTPLTEAEAERIYSSLEANFAIKSIDMLNDFDRGAITFLFGVEVPVFCDDIEQFVKGVIDDALDRAFENKDGSDPLAAEFSEALVGAFA